MKQSQFSKLSDLLEQVTKVDQIMRMHYENGSGFMASQYQAKREKLIATLIDELVSPQLISPRSIHTIKVLIEKFYGDEMKRLETEPLNDELARLEAAMV